MSVGLTNLGPNFTMVTLGDLILWFSYSTVIAFEVDGDYPVLTENMWGPTTGKHLNAIGSNRTRRSDFLVRLETELNARGM